MIINNVVSAVTWAGLLGLGLWPDFGRPKLLLSCTIWNLFTLSLRFYAHAISNMLYMDKIAFKTFACDLYKTLTTCTSQR